MGFIASSTTISIDAELTALGRKYLNNLLVGTGSLKKAKPVKFGLGDSDTNYSAITASEGNTLPTGFIPEAPSYKPVIRYHILKEGTIKPGRPIILSNVGSHIEWQIGNDSRTLTIKFTTEWPVGTLFREPYLWTVNTIDDEFENVFSWSKNNNQEIQLIANINLTRELIGYNGASFMVWGMGKYTGAKYGVIVDIKNTLDISLIGAENEVI